jgi:hypothetical protein
MASESVTSESETSVRAFLVRLVWMLAGPLPLAVCALVIAQRHAGWLTPLALFYFLVLGGMLLGSWAEFRYDQPMTATGEPASMLHLGRYAIGSNIISLVIWVAANVIGNGVIHSLG